MSATEIDQANLSPAQKRMLEEMAKQLEEGVQRVMSQTPKHLRELGKILRRSVKKDTMVKFRRFLKKHNIRIARKDLEAFRDHLIIHRIDLKDLEPEARERIFAMAHAREDSRNMTPDYRAAAERGSVPRCRDCRWFVTPPKDGETNGDKSCVEMGTKGADQACYGFTAQVN